MSSTGMASGATSSLPETAPAEWQAILCPASYYNADDGCDCGCGAPDPDCYKNTPWNEVLYGCDHMGGSTQATCVQGVCALKQTSEGATNLATPPTIVDPAGNSNQATGDCSCQNYASDGTCLCDCGGPYTSWMEGSNSFFECLHVPKNCSEWFEKYPAFLQGSNREHLRNRDWTNCFAKQCQALGDGTCSDGSDDDTNTEQCNWDGGDCCVATTVQDNAGLLPTPSQCKDPSGHHSDPWLGARGPCAQSVYTPTGGSWDHCAKGIIGIEHYRDFGSGSGRRRLLQDPGYYNTHASTYNASNDGLGGTIYGFPPDYIAAYNQSMYDTLGNCDWWSCQQPNLPRMLQSDKGDTTGVYQGEYVDHEFQGTAGHYLEVQLDGQFGSQIATTFELIAPDGNGQVNNPTDLVPHVTTSKAALLAQEIIDNGGVTEFNQTACLEDHATKCTCYSCMCSCGGELWDINSVPKSFCVPYGLEPRHQCPGAFTNHHRVYLDPPAGGYTLNIKMTRANAQDPWPMLVGVSPLPGPKALQALQPTSPRLAPADPFLSSTPLQPKLSVREGFPLQRPVLLRQLDVQRQGVLLAVPGQRRERGLPAKIRGTPRARRLGALCWKRAQDQDQDHPKGILPDLL